MTPEPTVTDSDIAAFCTAAAARIRHTMPSNIAAAAYEFIARRGGRVPVSSGYWELRCVIAAGLAAVITGRGRDQPGGGGVIQGPPEPGPPGP